MVFQQYIRIFNTRNEGNVILEPFSERERANMAIVDDFSIPYFYFHLPVIYDSGVLIPMKSFKTEFLTTANVSPSKIMPNVWGILSGPS